MSQTRTASRVALACYLLVLAALVLTPQRDEHHSFGLARRAIHWVAAHGIPLTFPVAEAAGNLLLFVPFGLLLGAMLGLRRWWVVWLAGSVTSAAIETIQLAIPGRWSTLQDWVLNTLGTALGLLVLVALRRRREPGIASSADA